MDGAWWMSLVWVPGAAVLGWAVSDLFAGRMQLSRRVFLAVYVFFAGGFLSAYLIWSRMNPIALVQHNWLWGAVAGGAVAAFLVFNIRSQPGSQEQGMGDLLFDFTWLGLVYGLIDALFLNVMPVLATWQAFAQLGWTDSWAGTIAAGALGWVASLVVTAAYHLGYPEFRNRKLRLVLVGNGLITLAYAASGSPLGAILSHVVMHLAAVNQGPETTIQLPPHYGEVIRQT